MNFLVWTFIQAWTFGEHLEHIFYGLTVTTNPCSFCKKTWCCWFVYGMIHNHPCNRTLVTKSLARVQSQDGSFHWHQYQQFYEYCCHTHCQCSLQFAGGNAEAVEHEVLAHAVDPFSTWRQRTAHKVTAFSFTAGKTAHNLRSQQETYTQKTTNMTISVAIFSKLLAVW